MVFGLDVAEAVFRRLDPEVAIGAAGAEGDWLDEPPAAGRWSWRATPARC